MKWGVEMHMLAMGGPFIRLWMRLYQVSEGVIPIDTGADRFTRDFSSVDDSYPHEDRGVRSMEA